MKKILLVISVLLLIPSYSIADQAATPAHDATPSAWLGWFKSLRRPTKQDAVRAWHYVQSKWRCMMHGEKCSKRHRNALRTLSAITTIVLGTAIVKYRGDRNKAAAAAVEASADIAAAADAFRTAARAARAAAVGALQAAAKVFPEIQVELKALADALADVVADYARADVAADAAVDAAVDAAADDARAKALRALATCLRTGSAESFTAVADALKAMNE